MVEPEPHPQPWKKDVEVVREAVTMALYVSLSLLAVLVALPPGTLSDSTSVALTVGLTAVALVLAHQVAFRISTRLVHQGILDAEARRLLLAQLAGGAAVTAVAVLPILILGPDAIGWTGLLLAAFVAVVGYIAARSVPMGRVRATLYSAGVVVMIGVILLVKGLIAH